MFVLSVEMIWLSEGKVLLVGRKLVFLCCSSTNRSDTFMKYPFDGRFASGFAINTGKSLGPAPTSWFHVFDGIGPHPFVVRHTSAASVVTGLGTGLHIYRGWLSIFAHADVVESRWLS